MLPNHQQARFQPTGQVHVFKNLGRIRATKKVCAEYGCNSKNMSISLLYRNVNLQAKVHFNSSLVTAFHQRRVGEQWPTQLGKHHFSQMRGCNGQVRVSRNPVCACVMSRKGWRRRTHQNGRHPRWSRTEAMRKGTSALWHCVSLSFDSLTAIYCWTNLLKSNKKCIFRIFKEMHIAPHTAVCQAPCLL